MVQIEKEIDRPLGQAPRRPAGKRFAWLRKGPLLAGLCIVALVAASASIAFRQKPFRTPEVVAVAVPEPVAAPAQPVAKPKPAPTSGGPQIIRVNPPESEGGAVVVRDPSAVGQNVRIAHLPEKALIEDSAAGPLPIRAADGRRPFDVYARAWSGARGARVAIVIGGLGLSQTGTQTAIGKLPPEITLGFAPQGNSLGRWMQAARREGHEIVMQVPLEPFDFPNVNPGRNTLTVDASSDENLKNLRWTLSRTTNYTAVMNYMGARFSTSPEAMGVMMAELGKRGIGYVDDGSSARSLAPETALKNGVPFATGDAIIDGVQDRGAILDKLDELERTARAKGFAIGTGNAFDVTVDAVASWASEARKRGIEIVPISAVASDPERG
ncbi:divergent polysaccharide deacetylase family protein [Aminobacter anthyllidis]|uniref:Divergent polysaccharide deacetylase family protein n=1 Tax=Aminobacter anthyllidis TaxID=1035067 RepID=A0A9X1AD99_9HYPH|nr:divergent polysaccharide deacetylase family protein [Aminobacter anthyllidis]MBT1157760.1 divergent polysaccharide deacetylase family protein [Aminobacter anthyllidis]MDH4987519.1 divergent polysaccharide deacetylase family protein [Aminobacter anthyllidis]